jgi:hypothetical protein
MAKRKKQDELPPGTLIGLMDEEMGAMPPGLLEKQPRLKPTFSEFQRGALWAMKLLDQQLTTPQNRIRTLSFEMHLSFDENQALTALSNVYSGVKTRFEIELMKKINEAEKEFTL